MNIVFGSDARQEQRHLLSVFVVSRSLTSGLNSEFVCGRKLARFSLFLLTLLQCHATPRRIALSFVYHDIFQATLMYFDLRSRTEIACLVNTALGAKNPYQLLSRISPQFRPEVQQDVVGVRHWRMFTLIFVFQALSRVSRLRACPTGKPGTMFKRWPTVGGAANGISVKRKWFRVD